MRFPLATRTYQTRSVKESSQQLVNLFATIDPTRSSGGVSGFTTYALLPSPGHKLLQNLAVGEGRWHGLETVNNITYGVYSDDGTNLSYFGSIVLDSVGALTWTQLGTFALLNSSTRVKIVGNTTTIGSSTATQILIATGGNSYLYTVGGAFVQVTDVDYPANVTQISAQDGFFLAVNPNTNAGIQSNFGDGTSWQDLNRFSIGTKSDTLVAIASLNQQLLLFGNIHTEVWSNIGASVGVTFSPQQGNYYNYGTCAPNSVAICRDRVYWLSRNEKGEREILAVSPGNTPQAASDEAMNQILASYEVVSDAFAYCLQKDGHEFYIITFPTQGVTWAFDSQTSLWTRLESYNRGLTQLNPLFTRWYANCHATQGGFHIVGDYQTGKLFLLDRNTYTDDDNVIRRYLVSPGLFNNGKYMSLYQMEIYAETGTAGLSDTPEIALEVSKDGGFTYNNQRIISFGNQGDYRHRLIWRLLGTARHFVFKITFTAAINFILLGCEIKTSFEKEAPAHVLQQTSSGWETV